MCIVYTGCKPLPWRLSEDAINRLDQRVRNIVYPHNTNGCSKEGSSFFKKSGRAWRTAEKIMALLNILPTALRDYVPTVRTALRTLVWGLRLLEGRCLSANEARSMGVLPGSSPITQEDIEKAADLIIKGLSELEGGCE